jgi:hypothetical protein
MVVGSKPLHDVACALEFCAAQGTFCIHQLKDALDVEIRMAARQEGASCSGQRVLADGARVAYFRRRRLGFDAAFCCRETEQLVRVDPMGFLARCAAIASFQAAGTGKGNSFFVTVCASKARIEFFRHVESCFSKNPKKNIFGKFRKCLFAEA